MLEEREPVPTCPTRAWRDICRRLISPVAHLPSLQRMGTETQRVVNVGGFTDGQRRFLEFHRNAVLLRAVR